MGCSASTPNYRGSPQKINNEDCSRVIKDKRVLKRLLSLKPEEKYTDPDFCGPKALYLNDKDHFTNGKSVKWKRPEDLTSDPQLFVDGISRLDIVQGDLGDCWFLCACAAVTLKTEIWTKVIPWDNRLFSHKGLYHFRFWRFGLWEDVYVDDLLPTRDNKMIYASSTDPNEIWPALIEKAYAKLNGCYESLNNGKASEGLLDLTGGLTEVYYPSKMQGPELFHVIRLALKNGAFLSCNTDSEHDGSLGLVTGHAYSISMGHSVPTRHGPVQLLRVFNPWGAMEWTGDWGDQSEKWDLVAAEVKESLGVTKAQDGEFWISFDDFCKHFFRVYICNLGPDFDMDGKVDQNKMYTFHGVWVPGLSAGGCDNENAAKYSTNPQYQFVIRSGDEGHTDSPRENYMNGDADQRCFLIASLMQKFDRSLKRYNTKLAEEYINFRLFELDSRPEGKINAKYFEVHKTWVTPILGEVDFTNTREITCRYLLNPGQYVLVPSTFDADVSATYLLRLYAWTNNFDCQELQT